MASNPSFTKALGIQFRVIGALFLREVLTRYGRHNVGFLWLFLEPMIFTLGIVALWTATRAAHGSSIPIVAFAITGYSTVLVWRNSTSRVVNAIAPNLSLMHHRNVKVMDIFVARISLEVVGATASFILLALFFISLGMMDPPHDILGVLSGWALMVWFGFSLAIVVGAISERSELVDRIWHTLSYLLFPLSGAVFMVDWLHPKLAEAVLLIPMVHGVEMIRESYFGPQVHAHYSTSYLVFWCLGLTLLGLSLARETGRRVQPE